MLRRGQRNVGRTTDAGKASATDPLQDAPADDVRRALRQRNLLAPHIRLGVIDPGSLQHDTCGIPFDWHRKSVTVNITHATMATAATLMRDAYNVDLPPASH